MALSSLAGALDNEMETRESERESQESVEVNEIRQKPLAECALRGRTSTRPSTAPALTRRAAVKVVSAHGRVGQLKRGLPNDKRDKTSTQVRKTFQSMTNTTNIFKTGLAIQSSE